MSEIEGADLIETDELHIKQPVETAFYRMLQRMSQKFAATRIGLYFIEQGDRVLRTIEDTAQWSLPKEKQSPDLQRPMPWLAFLMLIFLLRLMRFWLSLAALMIGNEPITAHDIVKFIQARRQKLQAIRLKGLNALKAHETEKANGNILKSISKMLLKTVCCAAPQSQTEQNLLALRQHWCTKNAEHIMERPHISIKRVNSNEEMNQQEPEEEELEHDDNHLNVDQMLNKYAEELSENDSDYIPDISNDNIDDVEDDDDDDDDDTATSDTSAISINELTDLKQQQQQQHEIQKPLFTEEPKINGNEQNLLKSAITDSEDSRKSTPGHISAAAVKINQTVLPVGKRNYIHAL